MMTRILVERWLKEGRYFVLGTDTHNPGTLPCRLDGLRRAIELVGAETVAKLTVENPRLLME
jgi:histidinol phosphatase-like PHP family hydrolase